MSTARGDKRVLLKPLAIAVGILGAAVGVAALGMVVFASIPDPDGTIHGCYSRNGFLRIIDADTATCTAQETEITWSQAGPAGPPGPSAFHRGAPGGPMRTTIDEADGAGSTSILTVGADGLGLIAYHAGGTFDFDTETGVGTWVGTGQLKVAHCENVECSSAAVNTIASDAALPTRIGLAVGADGFPLITYSKVDGSLKSLVAVHCNNVACASYAATVLASGADVGASSVAIDAFGLPIIAYHDETTKGVKVARCADLACTSAVVEVVDDPPGTDADIGKDGVAIAIGTDGNPIMAYGVDPNPDPDPPDGPNSDDVRVAHCRDIDLDDGGGPWTYDCADDDGTPNTKTTLGDTGVSGADPGIVIGADGLPFVTSFFPVWHCDTPSCAPTCVVFVGPDGCSETVDGFTGGGPGFGGWGGNSSPAVGPDGLITFLASDPQVGPVVPPILHCVDLACSRWTSTGVEGLRPASSLTIGADGLPLISNEIAPTAFGDPGLGLEVIHCTSAFCTPYFWRR